jgi:hypothetical protein
MENHGTKPSSDVGENRIKEKCLKIIALVDELNSWLSGSDVRGNVKLSR